MSNDPNKYKKLKKNILDQDFFLNANITPRRNIKFPFNETELGDISIGSGSSLIHFDSNETLSNFDSILTDNNENNLNNSIDNNINQEINMGDNQIALSYKILENLIPHYDGTSDVVEYCTIIDSLVNQCQQNQIPTFFFLVKNKLTGNARTVTIGETINAWADLRDLLIGNFNDEKTDTIRQNEFLNCRQKQTETIQNYADRIRKCTKAMVAKLNGNQIAPGKELLHQQAKIIFIDGLQKQIKEVFRFKDAETLEDAIAIAKQEKQLINNNNNPNVDLKYICSYCNQTGHYASNCIDLVMLTLGKNSSRNNNGNNNNRNFYNSNFQRNNQGNGNMQQRSRGNRRYNYNNNNANNNNFNNNANNNNNFNNNANNNNNFNNNSNYFDLYLIIMGEGVIWSLNITSCICNHSNIILL